MSSYPSAISNARSPSTTRRWRRSGSPTASIRRDGPPGHPDLKGFGRKGRIFFWLRKGVVEGRSAHVGFVADSEAEVDAAYAAAIAAGATGNGEPAVRLYYDPRYYAGNVLDPDGYSLEFVYKSRQHPQR